MVELFWRLVDHLVTAWVLRQDNDGSKRAAIEDSDRAAQEELAEIRRQQAQKTSN
jgi:hypothetical protein